MTKYTACICEGGAETAILDLLLDQNKLIFSRNDLLEGEILKTRKGKDFETRYLKKDFSGKITVYLCLWKCTSRTRFGGLCISGGNGSRKECSCLY